MKDRTTITDFIDNTLEDEGGFPVNSPDCMVLDQSVNNTWKNLKYGGLNERFQARRPSRRTNGGFINNVYTSCNEVKSEHIRNPIDVQRKVILEIIEKQGGPTTFLASNAAKSVEQRDIEKSHEFYRFFCFFCEKLRFVSILCIVQSCPLNCPFPKNTSLPVLWGK